MSIWGTGNACFYYGYEREAFNSIVNPKFQLPEIIEQVSVIDGSKNIITLGDYAQFDIIIHLNRYDNTANAFENFYEMNHKDVKFKPFKYSININGTVSGGIYLKDMNNNDLLFYVEKVEPFYLDKFAKYDSCLISITSKKFIDLQKSLNVVV